MYVGHSTKFYYCLSAQSSFKLTERGFMLHKARNRLADWLVSLMELYLIKTRKPNTLFSVFVNESPYLKKKPTNVYQLPGKLSFCQPENSFPSTVKRQETRLTLMGAGLAEKAGLLSCSATFDLDSNIPNVLQNKSKTGASPQPFLFSQKIWLLFEITERHKKYFVQTRCQLASLAAIVADRYEHRASLQ